MLVQKQTPKRLKKLLLVGGIAIALLAGYVAYINFFTTKGPIEIIETTPKKTAPKNFGQDLFKDSRFYSVQPKEGTNLIVQTNVSIAPESYVKPENVQVFDLRTGSNVLFSWRQPSSVTGATNVRINRLRGDSHENIATMPATTTSYIYTSAVNGEKANYEIFYSSQEILKKESDIPAQDGTQKGEVGVKVGDSGVLLSWPATDDPAIAAIEVYRSGEIGELGQRLARLDGSTSSYRDDSGKAALYFYTVIWAGPGKSGTPVVVEVTASDSTSPEQPEARATYDAALKKVRIEWSPSSSTDVVRYEVFRSTRALVLGERIAQVQASPVSMEEAGLFYEDGTAQAGNTYYYTVVAFDGAGNRSTTQELGTPGRSNPFIQI